MSETAPQRTFLAFLLLTAVVCGALIMVIQVLGSRVIGPFFGVSLYVWTSLISVTMIALAVGYAVGGWLADRRDSPRWLYTIVASAGIATLLVPWLRGAVLELSIPLGLRAGSFVATLLLFGPSLMLLGMVSPYLVKLASRQTRGLGMTVGGFYAVSTLGSVIGTVLTGFVLIATLGVTQIFQLTGLLLIALAAAWFVLFARRPAALALLLLALPGWFVARPSVDTVQANGTRLTEVTTVDSHYGRLSVVDYRFGEKQTRELIIDGLVQGGVDVASGQSVYEYPYFLEFLPVAYHPAGRTALVIGLGAGVVPRWYSARGVRTDVVDIDPEVVALARKHFGFTIEGTVYVEDARAFLAGTRQRYDYLIADVFNGDVTPGHLLSREAVALLAARITDDGIVAMNLIGSLGADSYMTASVVRTLGTAFEQVEIHPTFDPSRGNGEGNLVILAYQGTAREVQPAALTAIHPLAFDNVVAHLGQRFRFPEGTPALVLSDDFNPIDVYDASLRERVRRSILATTNWALLGGRG